MNVMALSDGATSVNAESCPSMFERECLTIRVDDNNQVTLTTN